MATESRCEENHNRIHPMTVQPLPGFVQIKTEIARAGVLDTSSRDSAVELAEVIAVGENIDAKPLLSIGDKIFVKSWAVDMINHNGEWFKFVHVDTKGILAVIREA